jgi:hypothetical protein
MFKDFEEQDLDIARLNYGTITLIPKVKEANKIKLYRPICLLNAIYNVFTKNWMLRLESIIGRLINRAQNSFIKGKNIMDSVMSLHEILHDTRARKKKGLVLKLDFEKAHDKISWNFLLTYLKRGFGEKWCQWIKKVMTSGTLSVRLNNT